MNWHGGSVHEQGRPGAEFILDQTNDLDTELVEAVKQKQPPRDRAKLLQFLTPLDVHVRWKWALAESWLTSKAQISKTTKAIRF